MRRTRHSAQEAISASRVNRGQVIVIVSGKGGVGKTNLAVNLGIELARRVKRAILLDADFGLANADILLNVTPLTDLSDLFDPTRSVDELLVAGPEGLRVLCGVSGVTRGGRLLELQPAACTQAVRRLERECDALVVDCGAGVSPPVVAFALKSDLLMVATTPEPTALADAYATLKLLCTRGFVGRVGVVVNMVRSRAEAARVAQRLSRVAQRFLGLAVEDLGGVVNDRHVPLAVRKRAPVTVRYPRCDASVCIREISRRVAQRRAELAAPRSVWARVASLFL